ncbi:MAG: hypothetical protein KGI46_11980 [Alphaproteobacteria bacterium]|nr:hypothetical protein [Alphaproteobacteria bacterium]MDE1931156.1 hypothetical protein [Alphaproteobacteria bacterium]
MRDRWPVFFAMTVSSLAVLATAVTAGLALSQGTAPAAFGLGLGGMLAASLGMFAIIRWTLDASETYPDYRYRRAVAAGPAGFAHALDAGERSSPPSAHPRPSIQPESLGDNVVIFDPTRARRKNRRAL